MTLPISTNLLSSCESHAANSRNWKHGCEDETDFGAPLGYGLPDLPKGH